MAHGKRSVLVALGVILALGIAWSTAAQRVKEPMSSLDHLAFVAPELRVAETPSDEEAIRGRLSETRDYDTFRAENGPSWRVVIDERRGRVALLDGGAIPWIPGPANSLRWEDIPGGCRSNACIPPEIVESMARDFLARYPALFSVRPEDLVLNRAGSGPVGESLYYLDLLQTHGGLPVEGAHIFFRINNGNLIQVGSEKVSDASLDPLPSISRATAWEVLRGYLGAAWSDGDEVLNEGTLAVIPVTPAGMDPEFFSGPVGSMAAHRLAYRIVLRRPGTIGTFEALVDAHAGTILRFVDINRYGHVHGGVYPTDGHTGEADRPFPFADIGGGQYTDVGGAFAGDSATVHLTGKYTHVNDSCGAINASTTTGDINFSQGTGTDCTTPVGNTYGAGNTHSSRTQFYHLTAINIKARSFLPSNTWLNNSYITVNVNQSAYCNASSGGGTLNFYKAASGCWNLGEIPGVSLHEWAHSMDEYDGQGSGSPPVETYADWTATLQIHDSCTGRGAFTGGNCSGYGDACLSCTGIRDADYNNHAHHTPWTPQNYGSIFSCSGGWYYGPCGWEDHCESGISTQALWDFVNRDLTAPPTSMDLTTAWGLADRLWYLGLPSLGNIYTCTGGTPKTSNGCGGANLYTVMRAIDDDGDGTANGTPHAAAIFAALARHGIACGTAGDATNQNSTSCTTLAAPAITGVVGSNQVTVIWSAVPGATRYFVFRNDTSCAAGFTRIATVTGTSHTDTSALNGLTSYYRVQAATANDSCVSPLSNCATVTPQPCAGTIAMDKARYGCSVPVNVFVVDSNIAGNPPTIAIKAWSTTDATLKTITLNNDPVGSANYTGSFSTTTSATPGPAEVRVSDGDTITVRYQDADYCGVVQNVEATATVDCAGPVISNVQVQQLSDTAATITWDTSEPGNSRLVYGTVTPPTQVVENLIAFSTSHSVPISNLNPCSDYYFFVASADTFGNWKTDNNGGAYYAFKTLVRGYVFGPDDAEGSSSFWTPTGTSSSIWHVDTCKFQSGGHSWKAGASDAPACVAPYGNTAVTDLTSATINLGDPGHGYHLRWNQWYSTQAGKDLCTPQISSDGGTTWFDLHAPYSGASGGWLPADVSLAAYSGAVLIRFRFASDASTQGTGWFVDDIEVSNLQVCTSSVCSLSCTASLPTSGRPAEPVSFGATASYINCQGSLSYRWTFGDGTTSTEPYGTHVYNPPSVPHTYAWTLRTTVGSTVCMKTGTITVKGCTLSCKGTAAPATGGAPLAVAFEATAEADQCLTPSTYSWSFGDGWTSSQKSVSHTYSAPGTYTWWLSVRAEGQICSKTGTVAVTEPCTLTCDATAAPSAGVAPLAVAFTGTATPANCAGTPTFAWTFGDGGASAGQSPSHTYAQAGTYSWKLTVVVDGKTCTKTGTVTVAEPCTLTCNATAAPSSGVAPLAVAFTGTATPANCGGNPAFAWTFGDGGASAEQNPAHTYPQAGSYAWTLTVTVDGKTCAKTGTVTVAEPCTLTCDATAAPSSGVAPLAVAFTGTATPANCAGNPAFAWTFGDGGASAEQSPSHTYAQAGSYAWTLTVTVDGKTCAKTGTVVVSEPCTLTCTASADPTSGVAPLAVAFTGTAAPLNCAGNPAYAWTFGDGGTSAHQVSAHIYPTAGTYEWTLTVTVDGKSCTKAGTVTVAEPCSLTCTATATPTQGTAPLAVQFSASAEASHCAGAVSYTWDFGDGYSSIQQSPSHTYASAGTYTWLLFVDVDDRNCAKTGTVTVSEPCTLTCDAAADPASGVAPLAVAFTGMAAPANCAGTPAYAWTFGDGGTSALPNPPHTYAAAGSYAWTLTVTVDGKTCTKTGTVTVAEPCTLTCDAAADPASGVAPLAVAFTGMAAPANCAGTPAYAWTFGDGGTSAEQNPSHTYAQAGSYAWTLTVTVDGKTCTKSGTVTVAEPCTLTCDASADPASGVAPLAVAFAGTAAPLNCAGTPAYAWTFGDGGTSAEQNPPHTYAAAGSYDWTLTVTVDGKTCTKTGTVTVAEPCTLTCTASAAPGQGIAPLAVAFEAAADASHCLGAPSYQWNFGDKSFAEQPSAIHTYSDPGSYTWTLTVTVDDQTCTRTGTVVVEAPCTLECTADAQPSSGLSPLEVAFSASATASNCGDAPSFAWAFGDEGSSTLQNPAHIYASAGSYTWTLTVAAGDKTCTRTGTVQVAPRVPGDCDGDGKVTIGELQKVANMYLGIIPAGCGADCNGDGIISIGEYQKAVNAYLGLPASC